MPQAVDHEQGTGAAHIGLHVALAKRWSQIQADWQDLWTVVQWQDLAGKWRDVEGWQGTLDGLEIDEDGLLVGCKVWWVAEADLGKGPFRWRVYRARDGEGELLTTSGSFYLPGSANAIQWVEVTLP